jgi:hypothetical protein
MKMRLRALIGLLFLLVALILSGCGDTLIDYIPYPSVVEWEVAIEILNSGEVEMVAQLHSLDVIFTLKDGSEIRTVEPAIDAIFQEVDRCGQICSDLILATE